MRNLKREIKFGIQGIVQNGWISLAVFLVLSVTISIWIVTFFSFKIGELTLKDIGKKYDTEITLVPGLSEEEILKVENLIKSIDEVESYEIIPREKAIEELKDILKIDDEELNAQIDKFNLSPSFKVRFKDPQDYKSFFKKIESSSLRGNFSSLEANKEKTTKNLSELEKWFRFLKISGLLLSGFFVILSFLIVLQAVKTSIESRKEEIEIMKLVGAEKNFIKNPFLIEVIISSIIASFFVDLLFFGVVYSFNSEISGFISRVLEFNAMNFYIQNITYMLLISFLGSLFVTFFSANLSIKKYLKI